MKPFKMAGKWWLPESPEKQVFGTLSCSESGELELSVLGSLFGQWYGRDGARSVILGMTDNEDIFLRDVTLADCFVTEQSGRFPGGTETLFAHRGYFGSLFANPQNAGFSSVRLELSGLPNWANGFSGLRGFHGPNGFQVSWESPEPVSGNVIGGICTLGVGCTTSSGRRRRQLTENVSLGLAFNTPLSASEIESAYVYPLQNLRASS